MRPNTPRGVRLILDANRDRVRLADRIARLMVEEDVRLDPDWELDPESIFALAERRLERRDDAKWRASRIPRQVYGKVGLVGPVKPGRVIDGLISADDPRNGERRARMFLRDPRYATHIFHALATEGEPR